MDINRLLLLLALGAAVSCSSGKYPLPVPEKPKQEQPDNKPDDTPDDTPDDKPDDKPDDNPPVTVTIMEAFKEDFSGEPGNGLTLDAGGIDFRSFPGFPSLTESGTKILMLRLNAAKDAGDGITLTSKDYVHFGSYSARVKLPDVKSVQASLGASVEFGPEGAGVVIDVASPTVAGINTASKLCVIGLDWSADKLVRWVKSTPSGDKKVIEEVTENVPQDPLKLVFRYYHTDGAAANYPYELEIDWIEYSPQE
jgi:hypothetical protein